jgi:hypothetical protein
MSTTRIEFDSPGGFSVEETPIITNRKEISNAHSIELKNSNFSDTSRKTYLLRGTESSILSLDGSIERIPVSSSTLNFVTSHIIAINASGTGTYSLTRETVVSCDDEGLLTLLSNFTTTIRDNIPTTDTWVIEEYLTGDPNTLSYITTRAGSSGAPSIVKWAVVADILSIAQ